MDISHNTTNVEFGVQVPTRLPFLFDDTIGIVVSKISLPSII